ncbi:MAG: phosphonate C-P lyase system protein PhnH [Alphaproteobacteria bacterium]
MLNVGSDFSAGFADPVFEAQETFRAILHGLSHPGRVVETTASLSPPSPLCNATAAIALTLFDFDTPVWLDPKTSTEEVRQFLSFHTGCPLVEEPIKASFAIVCDPHHLEDLQRFNMGTDEAPENSTTIIYQVNRIFNAATGKKCKGPGIKDEIQILVDGVSDDFWFQRKLVNDSFPRGIDMFFTESHRVVGLPRTTRIES